MRDLENLLQQMTLQEKVSLLAGSDFWHTTPIERLGIPSIKVSDGPNGARGGGGFSSGVKAACFPAAIALASTWNTDLVEQVGQALGQEAHSKGAHVLLAPTVNMHRSPLNGRNFECYSEDPYLSGRLATAYIRGVQSQGVGATIKHFVCNDSEYQRNSISSEVDERTMREIYLAPFYMAVQEARPWAVMASYNKINGVFASEHAHLLTDILRDEWGFDGIVMSDWMGTQSTVDSVNAGLDLEMPGPGIWRGAKLLQAVERGEVSESTLDASVLRLLRWIERTGAFEQPIEEPEQALDLPAHRVLIRQTAAEGMVLLKNAGNILPLQTEQLTSLALIGPNAKTARIMAGGSAQVHAHYAITPFDALLERVGEQVRIDYAIGCTNYKMPPLIDTALLTTEQQGGEHGFTLAYFNSTDLSGASVLTTLSEVSELSWLGTLPTPVDAQQFSLRARGFFTPQVTGSYTFSLISAGRSRLLLNGQQVINNWDEQQPGTAFFGMGSAEVQYVTHLTAGQPYELVMEYGKGQAPFSAVRLGCLPPLPERAIEDAAAVAAASDVALVFVGLSEEWESEGFDRPDLALVGQQVALIEQVAAANPKTIVVLNTGSPVAMPWLNQVAGVLQAWYPGQECGHAIADVLFGDVNPSGKLPQTFPVRLEDHPAFLHYPGEHGQVHYGEGVFIGYRYYEKKKVAPLFPFGFGLSYTAFAYANLQLSTHELGPDETLQVSIEVTNTGTRPGQEIIQVYIRDHAASVLRPEKELKAFAKIHLAASACQTVSFTLDHTALAYYDTLEHTWIAEAGTFDILVGTSSADIRAIDSFTLTTTTRAGGPGAQKRPRLSLDNPLSQLLADEEAREVLRKHLPQLADSPLVTMALNWRLEQIANMVPDILPPATLEAIAQDLIQIGENHDRLA